MAISKPLKPVYLIYGREQFLLEEALERLKEKVGKSADLDFNLTELSGPETKTNEIIQAADTLPFMSDQRLVVVKEVDQMPAPEISALADYIKSMPSHACLILVASKVSQTSRLYRAVEKKGKVYEYKPPRRDKYPNWVQDQFAGCNRSLTLQAARHMVEMVGSDLAKLNNEVEKICLFYPDQKKLDVDEVSPLLARSAENTVFSLVEALGAKDKTKALQILNSLLRSNESIIKILAVLNREFRLLLRAKALMEKGASNQILAQGLVVKGSRQLPSWVIDRYRHQSQSFSMDELKRAHKFLLEADLAVKSGEQDPQLVLETLAVNLSE